MHHKLLRCFLLSLIFFLPSFLHAEQKYKIGAILGLSGPMSEMGTACQSAMLLAMNDLDPALRERIDLRFEDDSLQSSKAVSAYRKFRTIDKVDAIITFTSPPSNAVAPLAETEKVPVIAIASDPKVVKGRKYVFILWVTPTEEAKVLVSEVKRRGYKKLARIEVIQDGMIAASAEIDRLNNGVFATVHKEDYSPDAKDFRPFLSKLQGMHDVEAIYVGLMPGQNGLFTRQARQLGIRVPFFNIETFEDTNDVKLSEGAMLGSWYVQADDPDGGFVKHFQEAYPSASLYGSPNCYDAVLLIAEALKRKIPLATFLPNVRDFKGALGTYSASGDQRFTLPATVKVVTEKGFEKLNPTAP